MARKKKTAGKPARKPVKKALTHTDAKGRAAMVNIAAKPPMRRRAVAECFLHAHAETIDLILGDDREGRELYKGDALAAARIAGVMAAKRTGDLIPLCHPLLIEHAGVSFERTSAETLRLVAEASITGRTGVEMEALTAVTIAALTLYDMAKGVDKAMRIEGVRLVEKTKEAV
jgi:cyclic pyranopterin phosphate synthase